MTNLNVTILVTVSLNFTGGDNFRRHEVQSFHVWLGGEESWMNLSPVLFYMLVEGKLSRGLRGKEFGVF